MRKKLDKSLDTLELNLGTDAVGVRLIIGIQSGDICIKGKAGSLKKLDKVSGWAGGDTRSVYNSSSPTSPFRA